MLPKAPNTILRLALQELEQGEWYLQLRQLRSLVEGHSRLSIIGQKVCLLWLSGKCYIGALALGDPYSAPAGVLIFDLTLHASHSDRQSFAVADLKQLQADSHPDGVCLKEREQLFAGHWVFEEISAGDLALVNS